MHFILVASQATQSAELCGGHASDFQKGAVHCPEETGKASMMHSLLHPGPWVQLSLMCTRCWSPVGCCNTSDADGHTFEYQPSSKIWTGRTNLLFSTSSQSSEVTGAEQNKRWRFGYCQHCRKVYRPLKVWYAYTVYNTILKTSIAPVSSV